MIDSSSFDLYLSIYLMIDSSASFYLYLSLSIYITAIYMDTTTYGLARVATRVLGSRGRISEDVKGTTHEEEGQPPTKQGEGLMMVMGKKGVSYKEGSILYIR